MRTSTGDQRQRQPRGSSAARLLLSALLGLLCAVGLSVGAPHAAAQTNDGLVVTTTKTYSPDPDNLEIDVTTTFVLTNVKPDQQVDGFIRSFFFTSWSIALPTESTGLTATAGGRNLSIDVDTDPDNEQISYAVINLPYNLNYQQTLTLDVSYSIPGSAPRGESDAARVNDSYLSFTVWVVGDPERSSVQLSVPDGFAMDFQGNLDLFERVDRDGDIWYEANELDAPLDFFGRVFGRNDDGLLTAAAELENGLATVRAWPDDPEWVDFVVDAIENDVPVIEELTGIDWPAGDIEVIETVTPYLYGYAGWFDADSGLIEVGEDLDRQVILHELAHAWFNDDLINGRWIIEGLAEEIASQTIGATGDIQPNPDAPDLDDPIGVPLNSWSSPWTFSNDEAFNYEQYHYNSSWWVLRQITDEIGLDGLTNVLSAIDDEEIAFLGDGPAETTFLNRNWKYFYDLLDEREGAENIDELFRTYVLGDADWLNSPSARTLIKGTTGFLRGRRLGQLPWRCGVNCQRGTLV